MPAAGLAAESGAPILFVDPTRVPAATADGARQPAPALDLRDRPRAAQSARRSPSCATSARSRRSPRRARQRRQPPRCRTRSKSRASPTARSAGASKNPATGWCSRTPARPLDAPARRCCRRRGDYGPLLLLESRARRFPPALAAYLGDIQPAYTSAPQFQPVTWRLQSRLADRRRSARSRRSPRPNSTRCWRSAPQAARLQKNRPSRRSNRHATEANLSQAEDPRRLQPQGRAPTR